MRSINRYLFNDVPYMEVGFTFLINLKRKPVVLKAYKGLIHFRFLSQSDVKKPKSTKHLHTVVLQETGSTVTKTVQLTLKQSAGSSAAARMNNRRETTSSQSPTPPGSPSVHIVSVAYSKYYSTHPCEVNFDLDICNSYVRETAEIAVFRSAGSLILPFGFCSSQRYPPIREIS